MIKRQLASERSLQADPQADPGVFDVKGWHRYFEKNKANRLLVKLPEKIEMDDAVRLPLLRSLQRFQIGESGEGHHLRKYAERHGDPVYSQCVDLFIKEEQGHAQVLAQVILSLDGTLLRWHWTDLAFICLRRLMGLKTELLILLIAEVIGKCFYKTVFDRIDNEKLEEVFSLIVLDEMMHLEFHTEFLTTRLSSYPWLVRFIVHYLWCMIFYAACFAFVADHRAGLAALDVSTGEFVSTSSRLFHRYAGRALSLL